MLRFRRSSNIAIWLLLTAVLALLSWKIKIDCGKPIFLDRYMVSAITELELKNGKDSSYCFDHKIFTVSEVIVIFSKPVEVFGDDGSKGYDIVNFEVVLDKDSSKVRSSQNAR